MAITATLQQGIPNWNSPFVDARSLTVTLPWQQFLLGLWQGSDMTVGHPAAVQSLPNVGPWTFEADVSGVLIVQTNNPSTIYFSRDKGTTWYTIGTSGGMVPMRLGDQVQLSYGGGAPPAVIWMPDS